MNRTAKITLNCNQLPNGQVMEGYPHTYILQTRVKCQGDLVAREVHAFPNSFLWAEDFCNYSTVIKRNEVGSFSFHLFKFLVIG